MINGDLHINYKQCDPNTTYSTGLLKAFLEQGSSFKIALRHPYTKECVKLGQNNHAVSKLATSSFPSLHYLSTGSSLISIDQSRFEQTLADFEWNSTDPNASQLSEMFWTLLLN